MMAPPTPSRSYQCSPKPRNTLSPQHSRTPQRPQSSQSFPSSTNTAPKIYTTKNLLTGEEETTPLPEPAVERLENSIADAISAHAKKSKNSADTKFAPRTAYGEHGNKVVVWSNHFLVHFDSNVALHVYNIRLSSTKARAKERDTEGRMRTQIIKLLLEENEHLQGNNGGKDIVTDFHSILISKRDLGDRIVATVTYRHEDEQQAAANAPSYQVEIWREKGRSGLRPSTFLKYMRSTDITKPADKPHFGTLVQALNIFLKFHARTHEDLVIPGRRNIFSFAQNSNPRSLGGGIVAMPGYFASVRPAAGYFLVNIDLKYAAFYDPNEELKEVAKLWSPEKCGLDRFLRFVRVMTKHLDQNKTRTICGLAKPTDGRPEGKDDPAIVHPPQGAKDRQTFQPIVLGAGPRDVHFWMEDTNSRGYYISVWDFFRQNHRHIRMDPNTPVVNAGSPKRPFYLPAEACQVQRGQNVKSTLDLDQTAKMVMIARKTPAETFNVIRPEGAEIVGLAPTTNPRLRHFGIRPQSSLVTVNARILPRPDIYYFPRPKGSSQYIGGRAKLGEDATWNMIESKVIRSGTMVNWRCLTLCPVEPIHREKLESGLFEAFKRQGITMSKHKATITESVDFRSEKSVAQFYDKLRALARELDILVVVLQDENQVVYNMVKSFGDIHRGLVTQCILKHRSTKGSQLSRAQYFDNVALKVNMKLRGENHLVDSPAWKLIRQNETLVIGTGVTHPTGSSVGGSLSFAALVGMAMPESGQYVARLSVQEGGQQMIEGIGNMFSGLLRVWASKHDGRPPKNLVYLRNGLSESQFDKFHAKEITKLREAYRKSFPEGVRELRVFAASVQKGHHKRFAPTKQDDADKTGNCKAGLVVDRGITEPRYLEFYLQAHTACKGTARPIHVVVACDEVTGHLSDEILASFQGNRSDFIQNLIYTFCWDLGHTTRATSLPAPIFYARLAADRAKRYIAEECRKNGKVTVAKAQKILEVHHRLKDTMFFV